MSGGSYDYAYHKIEDLAENIHDKNNPKRVLFRALLRLVADAAHDIEWVDSCDYSEGAENESIDKVFKFLEGNPEKAYKVAAFDRLREILLSIEEKESK